MARVCFFFCPFRGEPDSDPPVGHTGPRRVKGPGIRPAPAHPREQRLRSFLWALRAVGENHLLK